jgi:hypothetical protein
MNKQISARTAPRIAIRRDTIRRLSREDLVQAVGGGKAPVAEAMGSESECIETVR